MTMLEDVKLLEEEVEVKPVLGRRPKLEKKTRKLCLICSKGSLDMAYPPLILANAARMSGIEAHLFFTFWGLDIITKSKLNKLHVSTVGNPNMHIPTMLGGLPGMESFATNMMKKQIDNLDFPPVGEFLKVLVDSGAHFYACQMSMDMMKLTKEDVIDDAEIVGAMEFLELAEDAQVLFI